jgi:hypothetical protein
MKLSGPRASNILALSMLPLATTGCAAVEGIFKAGVWVGVLLVVVVLAIVVWAIKALLT